MGNLKVYRVCLSDKSKRTWFMYSPWLGGRVLDLSLKGRWLETHKRQCVVLLNKTLYPCLVWVKPWKCPEITEKIVDFAWDIKHPIYLSLCMLRNQAFMTFCLIRFVVV